MNKELVGSLAWGVGIVLLALGATWARRQGHLEAEAVTRLVVGANGLMLAWFGNRLPKAFVPSAWARRVRRVGGWSLFLSGLVYAGVWALAPVPVAVAVGSAAVLAGLAVTLGYCLGIRAREAGAGAGAGPGLGH